MWHHSIRNQMESGKLLLNEFIEFGKQPNHIRIVVNIIIIMIHVVARKYGHEHGVGDIADEALIFVGGLIVIGAFPVSDFRIDYWPGWDNYRWYHRCFLCTGHSKQGNQW